MAKERSRRRSSAAPKPDAQPRNPKRPNVTQAVQPATTDGSDFREWMGESERQREWTTKAKAALAEIPAYEAAVEMALQVVHDLSMVSMMAEHDPAAARCPASICESLGRLFCRRPLLYRHLDGPAFGQLADANDQPASMGGCAAQSWTELVLSLLSQRLLPVCAATGTARNLCSPEVEFFCPGADATLDRWGWISEQLRAMQTVDFGLLEIHVRKELDRVRATAAKDRKEVTGSTKQNRRGRKKADYETEQRDAATAEAWERARETGTYKVTFAKERGLTPAELDTLLDRVYQRNKRAEH